VINVLKFDDALPIKVWTDDWDYGTIEQARNLASLPFAFKHIALMPDCHLGYGMPIGGVLATKNVIIPNAVGKDIGCGMLAVKTNITSIPEDALKKFMGYIRKKVPVGFKHHERAQSEEYMPKDVEIGIITDREWESALKQIGTLGGGNHFIEIQKGSDGFIWIMIHSGSRNIGLKIADYYNKLAKKLNEAWYSDINPKWDLAFLPSTCKDYYHYMDEMNFAVEFALANRKLIMERVINCLTKLCKTVEVIDTINIPHNYARIENHFGKNVMVHRKGATYAGKDSIGIIPGSQGTVSHIVRGKGNPDSFNSCSHGAGRKMGRAKARKELNLEDEIKLLEERGIVHSIRSEKDLDEAPSAYKDISKVMANQADLVEVVITLNPLAVIKG
jgi:tRNA-splicing ligase RtcB